MTSNSGKISWADARKIAEEAVLRDKDHYETQEFDAMLEDEFLEAEHCRIFFRGRRIVVKPESWFTKSYGAFAVSKKGALSQITKFADDRSKLRDYLDVMSDYFGRRGE
jgi:hypothetical protein